MADVLFTDLQLRFGHDGYADLDCDLSVNAGAVSVLRMRTVSGLDNLAQALKLRLLIPRGELAQLGHPDYGSRVAEMIGETLDRPNLELLRRYVRKALKSDPRVADILSLTVTARIDIPGAVDVAGEVLAVTGDSVPLGLTMMLG